MAHVLVLPASTALVHRVGEGDVHVRIGEPERAAGAGRSPLRRLGAAPLDRQHVSTERAAFPERGEGLFDLGKREYPVHDRFDTAAGHDVGFVGWSHRFSFFFSRDRQSGRLAQLSTPDHEFVPGF